MHVIINFKATSWKKKIILAIVSLIIFLVNDTLISIFIALGLHVSDQWRKLDPVEFLEFRTPIEILLWIPMNILTTGAIFAYA